MNTTPFDLRAPSPKDSRAWARQPSFDIGGETINRWTNGTIVACASRHGDMTSKKTGLVVPQLHISVSENGGRASDEVVRGVLADFGFEGAEEDNHQPGIARNFWLDEGAKIQPDCECKSTEVTHVETDGFRWQGAL